MPMVAMEETAASQSQAVLVEGTELARMESVVDVLSVLSGVNVDGDVITVVGRGTPDIYIGNRKVVDVLELSQITPDRVREIEVLRHPGAEYDKKVESVIVIRLKPEEAEGLTVSNALRFSLTHKLSPSDELTLTWRRKALMLGAFVGWNEKREYYRQENFINRYMDRELIAEERDLEHDDVKEQWLTARCFGEYNLNRNGKLTFMYSLLNKNVNRTWVPEASQLASNPDRHHEFSVEYTGKLGEWNVTLGNNSYIDKADKITTKPTMVTNYLRREYDLRTYAMVSGKMWNGSVTLGAEHELDHMNVRMYDDNPAQDPSQSIYLNTHAVHPDNTLGLFATTTQRFGRWSIEAGLRYEHIYYVYRPCDDDGLLRYIDDNDLAVYGVTLDNTNLIHILKRDREVSYKDNILYPSLKASVDVGKSNLSLSYTTNSIRPYLGITRLRYSEMELLSEKILWTERTSAASLDWKYGWLDVALSYFYYKDPICKTLSSTNQYNATDYDAVDLDVTLSPKIGVWSPMLHARLHKQWFEMPLASGKDRLKKPFASITFNNTVTLPHNWVVRLNSQWHSRGAERNNHYFSNDIKVSASVQKSFPRQRLSLTFCALNMFRSSYNDIGRYVKEYYGLSQGIRERYVRTIALTIRYKLGE